MIPTSSIALARESVLGPQCFLALPFSLFWRLQRWVLRLILPIFPSFFLFFCSVDYHSDQFYRLSFLLSDPLQLGANTLMCCLSPGALYLFFLSLVLFNF